MSNSSLVSYTKLSPNHSGKRTHSIDRITPHCVVGQLSCESIAGCFPAGREASCNYGIGTDGRISLIVEEKNRSWCSSSNANDQRAVTIECASDKSEPYAMNSKVYASLVKLCVDICKRNGKKKLMKWLLPYTVGSQTKAVRETGCMRDLETLLLRSLNSSQAALQAEVEQLHPLLEKRCTGCRQGLSRRKQMLTHW